MLAPKHANQRLRLATVKGIVKGKLRGRKTGKLKRSFWLMTTGMIGIVISFVIAGVLNVYLTRTIGLPFISVRDQYLRFWITGVFLAGQVLFLPGITLYVLNFFHLSPRQQQQTPSPMPVSTE